MMDLWFPLIACAAPSIEIPSLLGCFRNKGRSWACGLFATAEHPKWTWSKEFEKRKANHRETQATWEWPHLRLTLLLTTADIYPSENAALECKHFSHYFPTVVAANPAKLQAGGFCGSRNERMCGCGDTLLDLLDSRNGPCSNLTCTPMINHKQPDSHKSIQPGHFSLKSSLWFSKSQFLKYQIKYGAAPSIFAYSRRIANPAGSQTVIKKKNVLQPGSQMSKNKGRVCRWRIIFRILRWVAALEKQSVKKNNAWTEDHTVILKQQFAFSQM